MNKLPQTKQDAKRAFLAVQQAKMLDHFKTVSKTERTAIIKQIESFLPVISSKGERAFWQEFRKKLETLNRQIA